MSAHSRAPNAFCATCLSQDRQMFTLPLQHIKPVSMFYKDLTLTEEDEICWECKRFVIKMVNFKDRALKAQRTLAAMLNKQPTTLQSLSKLTISNRFNLEIKSPPQKTEPTENLDPLLLERIKSEPDSDYGAPSEWSMEVDPISGNTDGNVTFEVVQHEVNKPTERLLIKLEPLPGRQENTEVSDACVSQKESVPCGHERTGVCDASVSQKDPVPCGHERTGVCDASVLQKESVPHRHDRAGVCDASVSQKESVPHRHEMAVVCDATVSQKDPVPQHKKVGFWETMLNRETVPVRNESGGVWSGVGFADATLMSLLNRKHVSYPPPISVVPQRKLPMMEVPTLRILPKNPTPEKDVEKHSLEEPEQPVFDPSGPSFTEERLTEEERQRWWESKKENEFYAKSIEVFKCAKCVEPFFTRRTFLGHEKMHTETYGKLSCDVCELRFHTEQALATHKDRHYRLLKCTRCAHAWDTPNSMRRHCETEHSVPVTLWNCDICSREFTRYRKYLNHIRGHGCEECPQCGKKIFDHMNRMKYHLLTHKDMERLFKCSECDKSFKHKAILTTHVARVHTGKDAVMYCAQCNKQFKNAYSYNSHMKYSGQHVSSEMLTHNCTECSRVFPTGTMLRRHTESAHSDERRYECTVCHTAQLHRVQQSVPDGHYAAPAHGERAQRRAEIRVHSVPHGIVCRFILCRHNYTECSRVFPTGTMLRRHTESAHSDERRYECTVCHTAQLHRVQQSVPDGHYAAPAHGERAQRRAEIRVHSVPHGIVCRFILCRHNYTECSRVFLTGTMLRRHTESAHSDERRYECTVCHTV
ncbi:zinc finger protein 91-like [Cydia fagiglandana]|uniref:zinc finger protein 91-like n=1 Tax=Cydia fagiglandana TaxID=1458189 RepID=UPI002FEE31B7